MMLSVLPPVTEKVAVTVAPLPAWEVAKSRPPSPPIAVICAELTPNGTGDDVETGVVNGDPEACV